MNMTTIRVSADKSQCTGIVEMGSLRFPCALGKSGLASPQEAAEGDNATPMGQYRLTEGFWRADRMDRPRCALPLTAIDPETGWCDDPEHPLYNQQITQPFPASHETLWRMDNRYDLLFVLDFNRDPIIPGRGSAIFLHVTTATLPPTRGCIALGLKDLLTLAARFHLNQQIIIAETGA